MNMKYIFLLLFLKQHYYYVKSKLGGGRGILGIRGVEDTGKESTKQGLWGHTDMKQQSWRPHGSLLGPLHICYGCWFGVLWGL